MSLNWAENNHNYVPAYQQSGIPYVTSSAVNECTNDLAGVRSVRFPYVTRWVVINTYGQAGALRIGFTANGVMGVKAGLGGLYDVTGSNNNYFVMPKDTTSDRLEIKCTEMFFRGHDASSSGFSLMAGYTNIPPDQFLVLTGSNLFQGVG